MGTGLALTKNLQDLQEQLGGMLEMKLTKEDFIAMAVTKAEDELLARKQEAEEEQKLLQKEIDAANKACSEARTKWLDKVQKAMQELVEDRIGDIFKKIHVKVAVSKKRSNKAGARCDFSVEVHSDRNNYQSLDFNTKDLKASKVGKAAVDATRLPAELAQHTAVKAKASDERGEVTTRLLKIECDLQQIGRMDRRARSDMAMALLKQTPAGKKLLLGFDEAQQAHPTNS